MGNQKHLRKVGKTYFVRMAIPADVRHAFGGKVEFVSSTRKQSEVEANVVAGPILLEWKRRVEAVRQGIQNPDQDEFDRLASEYRRYRGKSLDEAGAAIVMDVIDFVMRRSGLSPDKARELVQQSASLSEAFTMLPNASRVETTFNQITGKATPFLTYIKEWEQNAKQDGKTLRQMLADLRKFDAVVRQPIEALTGGHVQKWLYELKSEKTGKPADEGTKQRKLSSLRAYWKHLVAMEHVAEGIADPFSKRITANRETDAEAQDRERIAFNPEQVPSLWERARADGDQPLADLIQLAAYTGARLGEIMNWKAASVVQDGEISCLFIPRGKRRASRRMVPIHPDIRALVEKLVEDAGQAAYLITCDSKNRTDTMSKRFGRMKKQMGYDEIHVFHCLRHTVIQMFREVRCPLEVRNLIVGHEDGHERANSGAGYGDLSARGRLAWVEKAIHYPVKPVAGASP